MKQGEQSQLWAIGPLDGRYATKVSMLQEKVSEGALIWYRIRVEAMWLLHLAEIPEVAKQLKLSPELVERLQVLSKRPDKKATYRVKETEKITNHDVKAVEYYLRDELTKLGAGDSVLSFIHFACTSEDINNLSYGLMLKETRDDVLLPKMDEVLNQLRTLALDNKSLAMLARTHGQTASPTTLGKEMAVYVHRLGLQSMKLKNIRLDGKINGAVGNFNAHYAAYSDVDWVKQSRVFVEDKLGLKWNPLTTQIENHDGVVEYADIIRRFNTIGIDLSRDIWGYISLGYFKQQTKAGEVGSSTMPHKVNPIDFENAEGNFGLSSSLASHFSDKLPISRWQRDLSDSTVLRALGVMIGHNVLALASLTKGLSKLQVNEKALSKDLDGAWEVLGEAIQTVMRRYGVFDAYERLKTATRGQAVTKKSLYSLIESTNEIPEMEKKRLMELTPSKYIGVAPQLVDDYMEYHNENF